MIIWKIGITNYCRMIQKTVNKNFVQSATDVYYKACQVLQIIAGCYYKVRQTLQSVTVITKWDVTVLCSRSPCEPNWIGCENQERIKR